VTLAAVILQKSDLIADDLFYRWTSTEETSLTGGSFDQVGCDRRKEPHEYPGALLGGCRRVDSQKYEHGIFGRERAEEWRCLKATLNRPGVGVIRPAEQVRVELQAQEIHGTPDVTQRDPYLGQRRGVASKSASSSMGPWEMHCCLNEAARRHLD
jgi:hypothetical protein